MSLASAVADLVQEVKRIPNLATGQIAKWNRQVSDKLQELESWKNNFESAGIGLKKYKGVISSRSDYYKCVLPLVELTDGNGSRKSSFSYTEGRFSLVRLNGCCVQSSCVIDIKAIAKYNSEDMDLYKIALDADHAKPCKFTYNGKLYGGLDVYFTNQSSYLLFDGWSNCHELKYIPYEDVRGDEGDGILNEEVKNSLEILEA